MFNIVQEASFFCISSNEQILLSPNGHPLKSKHHDLVHLVVDYINENGLPKLGEVNPYNLFIGMVDTYPDDYTGGKAQLRKQLWRDPVFHSGVSRELEASKKYVLDLVQPWYKEETQAAWPKLTINESLNAEDEGEDDPDAAFFPLEELKAQWPDYNKIVKHYEYRYNKLNVIQKTVMACLLQTFEAFHISLYLMFVLQKISPDRLADCLYHSYDLPMESIGQAPENSADEEREMNLEEFKAYAEYLACSKV